MVEKTWSRADAAFTGDRPLDKDVRTTHPGARLTIDRLTLMGFRSATVARIDLDAVRGKAALAELTREDELGQAGPPLRALVASVQGCASVAEVVAVENTA